MNVVIYSTGEILQALKDTKQALMKNLSTKSSQKQITARRDIRIYINSIFFMEKRTFTVFVHSMINNTITLILAK